MSGWHWFVRLRFGRGAVKERVIMLVDMSIAKFLDELGADRPTPGGGCAAALAGAAGAALVGMVAELTLRSEKYASSHAAMTPVREKAAVLRKDLTALVDRDAEAYNAVIAAGRMPRGTTEEKEARTQARARAILFATETPLRTSEAALAVIDLAAEALEAGINTNAASDLGAAALLAHSALQAAALNVEINLPGLAEPSSSKQIRERLDGVKDKGAATSQSVITAVREMLGS